MVECTALEMRHRCKPIGGSNPSLSAKLAEKYLFFSAFRVGLYASPYLGPYFVTDSKGVDRNGFIGMGMHVSEPNDSSNQIIENA